MHGATIDKLPPIIDYYPNCDYQVIKQYQVKDKVEKPRAKKVTKKLFIRLREEALSVGADAVIIEKRNLRKDNIKPSIGTLIHRSGLNAGAEHLYIVSYQALLIKTCQDFSGIQGKVAPYNHLGDNVRATKSTYMISTEVIITPPEKAKLYRPNIAKNSISLTDGIYGIKIGAKYAQVVALFGDPSIELSLFEGEKIIAYGRHHWLHFQEDQLVKASSKSSLLSQDILNKVPLMDFFDDSQWKIDGLIGRKASLDEVKSALNIKNELNKKNQLIIKNIIDTLTLNFSYSGQHDEKIYTLSGFTLQKNSYKKLTKKISVQRKTQFNALKLASSKLDRNEDITWSELSKKLGGPIGRITVSATSYINIYNENLAIFIKNTELDSIYLLEQIVKLPVSKTPWSLGKFAQGKTITQLSKYFPDSVSIYENEAEIDTDNYKLSLYFDYDDLGLYEAKLKVY